MRPTSFSLSQETGLLVGAVMLVGVALYTLATRLGAGTFSISLGQLLWALYIFLVLLLIVFVVQVLRPLQRTTRQMRAALHGETYKKLSLTSGPRELRTLAEFFNTMISSIEEVSADVRDRQRLAEELDFAADFQKHLMPKVSPKVPGLDVVVKTRPATEVGGDNFDIITLKDSTLFYVGDATGHGLQAGLLMSMVSVLVHTFAELKNKPSEILTKVNQFLTPKILPSMFMTLVMLRWEHATQKLYYTGCGHEYILIYHAATGKCEALKTGGLALGLLPSAQGKIVEHEIDLAPNDVVVLYTDGITESQNAKGEMYDVEHLRQSTESHAGRGKAESIFNGISQDFARFVGKDYVQADDTTLFVLKYNFKNIRTDKNLRLEIDTAGISAIEKPNWSWGKSKK